MFKRIILVATLLTSASAYSTAMVHHHGTLKSYDGAYLRMETQRGEVRIPKQYVSFGLQDKLHTLISKKISVAVPAHGLKDLKFAKSYKR